MRPASPVDVDVAVEKKVVISPLPLVVVAGTKLVPGPNKPPPFEMIRVEAPEIIVVVAPLMMVVTYDVAMVTGTAVGACCTIV
jgi:hypothetical protein